MKCITQYDVYNNISLDKGYFSSVALRIDN
ncbi:MAG: hypothetical protein ACI843_002252 [Psychrobacter glaciei]|jgi:hypothetical protein